MAEKKELSFMERLNRIQIELKAPKDLYNNFGKYKYRSAERILEAIKPLLDKYRLVLDLDDTVQEVGGRVFLIATATVTSIDSLPESRCTKGWAEIPTEKKGMDASQITGTASSYARKYALNGLFLLDDTKDADTDEHVKETTGLVVSEDNKNDLVGKAELENIEAELQRTKVDKNKILKSIGVKKFEELTMVQYQVVMNKFKATPTKEE